MYPEVKSLDLLAIIGFQFFDDAQCSCHSLEDVEFSKSVSRCFRVLPCSFQGYLRIFVFMQMGLSSVTFKTSRSLVLRYKFLMEAKSTFSL